MGILQKGTTYVTDAPVTASNLNAHVDDATFSPDAVDDISTQIDGTGAIVVKDGGVKTAKLENSTSTTTGVTFNKLRHIANNTLVGNTSGSSTVPSEVTIFDEDDFVSDSDTGVPTQQSTKAYVDTAITASETDGYTPTSYTGQQSIEHPNGYIMKFGTRTGNGSVTFDTPFPTAAVNAQVSVGPTGSGSGVECTVQALSTTSITLWNNLGIHPMYWQVIGY